MSLVRLLLALYLALSHATIVTIHCRYAVALSAAPALDFCESVCECSHALSVSHAQVTYAVSRMTQERVLALYRGYVCQLSRMMSIPFAAMPPSSLTLSADSCMLQQLSGPLSLFQRIVLVAPEAHTRNEPIPYSNSLTAALSISVPDLKADITQMVLSVAKRIGADCAQISGNPVPCACFSLSHCDFYCFRAASITSQEGSIARAIFSILQSTADCKLPDAIETKSGFCSMCMEDDETLMLAPCGHGFCKICWQGYITTAVVDGSTTQVQKGVECLLDVSQLQCPGCKEEDKYQEPSPAPFLTLSFLQSICPPATSHSFNQRICDQLASKFLRSNLPGALCPCGSAIIGMFQVEFS